MQCPECLSDGVETNWRPKPGYDQQLKEFECLDCEHIWYQRIGENKFKKEVEDAANIQPGGD